MEPFFFQNGISPNFTLDSEIVGPSYVKRKFNYKEQKKPVTVARGYLRPWRTASGVRTWLLLPVFMLNKGPSLPRPPLRDQECILCGAQGLCPVVNALRYGPFGSFLLEPPWLNLSHLVGILTGFHLLTCYGFPLRTYKISTHRGTMKDGW
jgi:hypothetical protein